MSETTNRDESQASSSEQAVCPRPADIKPRIWPAAVILLIHLAVAYGFHLFGSTNIQSAIALAVVPLGALVLLLIWWLFASRTPILDRLLGFVVFIAAALAVVFSQADAGMGGLLLATAMPIMTSGIVILMFLTLRLRWAVCRWILVGFLVICAGIFCAKRVESIGGDLAPATSWRWNPSQQGRSLALSKEEVIGTATIPPAAGPGDWPEFRGGVRDGIVTGVKFSTDWSKPPSEVWRRPVGAGWSSLIVVGNYLFTQEQRGEDELVSCYETATGKIVWMNRIPSRFEDAMGLGPRATPTFCQGRLYTQGGTGAVQCMDAATGNTIWKRDLTKDAEARVPGYGFACSPLIVGNLAVTFSGGADGKNATAYNRETGEIAWQGGHHASAYSSPQLMTIGGVPQLVMMYDFGLQSFTPETGAVLWEHEWRVKQYARCIQPLLVEGDYIMLGATGSTGSGTLKIEKTDTAWNVSKGWLTKKFRPYFNDGVALKGNYYGYDGERLACIDLKTGERRWQGELYGGQVLLLADMDMLLVLSEKGEVVLVSATPEKFTEVARFNGITGKTWNHPTIAHGKLFVRNSDEMACYELAGYEGK